MTIRERIARLLWPGKHLAPATATFDVIVEEADTMCLFHIVSPRAEAWVACRLGGGWYTIEGALVVGYDRAEVIASWMRIEGLQIRVATGRGTV